MSVFRTIVSTLVLATLVFSASAHAQSDAVPQWRKVGSDLEVALFGVASDDMFTPELALVRTSLRSLKASVLRAADFGLKSAGAKTICSLSKATLCVNANFFDEDGKALGLVVSRGIMLQKIHAGGSLLNGIFQASRRNISIVDRLKFDRSSAVEAVQSGPILLHDGNAVGGIRDTTSRSRRAGVCIDKQGRLIIFCSSSNFGGVSIERLQGVLLSQGIECRDALNFDGGASAQLFLSDVTSSRSKSSEDEQKAHFDLIGGNEAPVFLALSSESSNASDG